MSEKPDAEASASGESGEEGLIQARREKAARVRARGENPFANDLDPSDRISCRSLRERFEPALLEPKHELRYDPERVAALGGDDEHHVAGRLMARRGFGKASFLRLRDGSGELQLFAKQDTMGAAFAALDDVDVADHVEARGRPMVTKTGELSLELQSLRLLTKAMRPLPDKWHGMSDVDLRYRRRYVDTVANPDAAAALRARSAIVQGLRAFLDGAGFMEVETPTLHTVIGGAAARPFTTHHNTLDLDLYLRIAPELYLKRLLVGGFERVYEIGRCYRNEGISTRHNPEFTMLEFYMSYATYGTLMDLTEQMLRSVDGFLEERFRQTGQLPRYQSWKNERSFSFDEPFARVPMKQAVASALERANIPFELFERMSEIALAKGAETGPGSAGAALVGEWAKKSPRAKKIDWTNFRKGLGVAENDGERLFCAYEYLAEPFLAEDYRSSDGSKSVPVFIIDYPAEVSPLARRKDSDPTLVDRFELFVDGRELCNAFSELNDPEDQAARFAEQVAKKTRGAEETMDYDADYIRALEHGMPPAAGFGLGVDRLVMMLACQPSIRDVIAFPLLRPEAD
ncbi:MAG: lysine--tRNA ligase [Polyangiaceae bacterium]|nr:lysine--tRNA ligase [Polyangiaceae bacterium]MCE7890093.1 lysine--tRNA ligase [Sorangiineae bacterium PRO1]MCL4750650.1 lysine--tRNA ligase [Myxococcales bacterium]